MSSPFEQQRGVASGRIVPASFTPPAGVRAFVLGRDGVPTADSAKELLAGDDSTEVRQIVDLTGYDLVGAIFDTHGAAADRFQPRAGWRDSVDADGNVIDLFRFSFDQPTDTDRNYAPGAFHLTRQGDMAFELESYSPDPTYCRGIPSGSILARLAGSFLVPRWTGPLAAYTLEAWVNFDSDSYATSAGVNPTIVVADELGVGSIVLGLAGDVGPGAHRWFVSLYNENAGVALGVVFLGWNIDPSPGWKLLTAVFDSSLAGLAKTKLYVDGVFVSTGNAAMTPNAAPPSNGTPVYYGHPQLTGQIDATRLLPFAMTAPQVLNSYNECVALPPLEAFEWRMEALIDGVVVGARVVDPNERRHWTDFWAPCRNLDGYHEVSFRLRLVKL